ncbi:MAG: hypothetical protein QOH68_2621 [Nocardioidaceae bacterium]|nr:hypothetical protein [Nocardioidaceae bacterium]
MQARDESKAIVLVLDGVRYPDLGLVDALARLQLEARRVGCTVHIRDPFDALRELLELVGLSELLLEAVGQPECGEELGSEEVVEPGDASA